MASEPARQERPRQHQEGGTVLPFRRAADLGPTCPLAKCDGTGWIDAEDGGVLPCDCRSITRRRTRAKGLASTLPARYRGVSFDRPPLSNMLSAPESRTVTRAVRDYASSIDERLEAGQGLWISGSVGTGKTTLAMAVSKAAIEAGRSVAIYSMPRLLARIRKTYDGVAGEDSYTQFFSRLTSVDLLHIDDLGAEKQSDWVLEQLYSIVDERYSEVRSIVVTSNLDYVQLKDQIGDRVVSRLTQMCQELPLEGDDRRDNFAV